MNDSAPLRPVHWIATGLFVVSALSLGCAPTETAEFVVRDSVKELPAQQQQQLVGYLEEYYGTATNPRWMTPADPAKTPPGEKEPAASLVEKVERSHLLHGLRVYTQRCAACHGTTGDGAGPAAEYLDPKPRDYRPGIFKFISTIRGSKPRREDLARLIRHGAKGTSMPSFRWLNNEDLNAVIDYVMLLSHRGELEIGLVREAGFELDEEDDFSPEMAVAVVKVTETRWAMAPQQVVRPATIEPPYTDESIALGAQAFEKQVCTKCHGRDGKGGRRPGIRPEDLGKDDWGRVAYPADLTAGMLHGGRRPVDIYRRIYAGINGTPMPGSADAYKESPETIWNIVHFITSIVEGRQFELPGDSDSDAPPQDQTKLEAPAPGN